MPGRGGALLTAAAAAVLAAGAVSASAIPGDDPSRVATATAGESHLDNPRQGLREVGFHPLHGTGFNTDVWTQITNDGRLFGYSGTWGTLTGGDPCPSEDDDPSRPRKSGVKIVDASKPAEPRLVTALGTVPGAQNNDVKVLEEVATAAFKGDLLVHSLEPCGVNLGIALVDGVNDLPRSQTGFQLYDVTNPARPVRLAPFNNGALGTHNLYPFNRPDLGENGRGKAYVAAVHNDLDLVTGTDLVGKLQLVDVSDPNTPRLASEWQLVDAEQQGGPRFEALCRPRGEHLPSCNLHDVWVSADGRTAYLSYWDAGLVLLDITQPTAPRFIGQVQPGGTDNEGNTHAAVPYRIGGKHFVIVGDEDFVGPGPAPHTLIAAVKTAGAKVTKDERFQGVEFSNTRPLEEGAVGPFAALPSDDGFGCSYGQASAFGATLDGWIAVVRRGGVCPLFQLKVTAAEMAGAAGLIVVNDEPEGTAAGTATGGIPAMMIEKAPGERLLASISAARDNVAVTMQLLEPARINPWGFMRVVDVTDRDPARWKQVATFKAPHVDTVRGQGRENNFSAHNPIVGPDGRVYFAWYTDGVRVLEPVGDGGEFREVA